jgi:hypothetical protein
MVVLDALRRNVELSLYLFMGAVGRLGCSPALRQNCQKSVITVPFYLGPELVGIAVPNHREGDINSLVQKYGLQMFLQALSSMFAQLSSSWPRQSWIHWPASQEAIFTNMIHPQARPPLEAPIAGVLGTGDKRLAASFTSNSNRRRQDNSVIQFICGDQVFGKFERLPLDIAALDKVSDLSNPLEPIRRLYDRLGMIFLRDLRSEDQTQLPRGNLDRRAVKRTAPQCELAQSPLLVRRKLRMLENDVDIIEVEGTGGPIALRRLVQNTNADRPTFAGQSGLVFCLNHLCEFDKLSTLVIVGKAPSVDRCRSHLIYALRNGPGESGSAVDHLVTPETLG